MNKRILREISNAQKSNLYKFSVIENKDDPSLTTYRLDFVVEEGCFKGQKHSLDIKFIYANGSKTFPEFPPQVLFITKILHPNISINGMICVDAFTEKWSPMMNLDTVFNIILLLLEEPNPSSPLNATASTVFRLPLEDKICVIQKYYEENN